VTLEVDVGRRVAWRVFPGNLVADRTLTIRVCTEHLVTRYGVCGCGAALRAGDGGLTLAGSFVGWNDSVCLRPQDAMAFDPVRAVHLALTSVASGLYHHTYANGCVWDLALTLALLGLSPNTPNPNSPDISSA
jgi:hypothetical protein